VVSSRLSTWRHFRFLWSFGTLVWLLSIKPALALDPGWQIEPRAEIPTSAGIFKIDQVGEDGYRLMIGERVIRELESFYVGVLDTFPPGPDAKYILIGESTGGGSCPDLYRLVDLSARPAPYLTETFGDCNGDAQLAMKDGILNIEFPTTKKFLPVEIFIRS
jgi:hypothetical protein